MRFDAVMFDLDGTLLDTIEDLADSMNAVLASLGHEPHDVPFYKIAVGDGIHLFAERSLPAAARSAAAIEETVRRMRAEYARRWAAKTRPYGGVPALLGDLAAAGLRLAVLSNKPDDSTRRLVDLLLPGTPFAAVRGALPDVPPKPDPAGALDLAREVGVSPTRWLYVGDTDTDMRTARAAGMPAAGVLWGFRDAAELRREGAAWLVATPADLLPIALADGRG